LQDLSILLLREYKEMKQKLSLFIFIDALGWEILNRHPWFLKGLAADKKKLKTIFGYSSACDPSIISGMLPQEHLMWSSFYYSPETCPYSWTKWLSFLPDAITDRSRIRHVISRFIANIHGFTGYFQIYQIPFRYLPYFDYAEKRWMWGTKDGLLKGKTIFDRMIERKIPFYVKPSVTVSDEQQWSDAASLIQKGCVDFAYLFLGKLDAVMHAHGTNHPLVEETLQHFESKIRSLISEAEKNYKEIAWYVFSDHGMHNVTESYDLKKDIDSLNLIFGKDYAALYDSTMARFWFLNQNAREKIHSLLSKNRHGRILAREELQQFGTFFPDHRYGELIFLMDSGTLIVPSFMTKKQIPGMHGYHPEDPDSAATILGYQKIPAETERIEQIYRLMTSELGI